MIFRYEPSQITSPTTFDEQNKVVCDFPGFLYDVIAPKGAPYRSPSCAADARQVLEMCLAQIEWTLEAVTLKDYKNGAFRIL